MEVLLIAGTDNTVSPEYIYDANNTNVSFRRSFEEVIGKYLPEQRNYIEPNSVPKNSLRALNFNYFRESLTRKVKINRLSIRGGAEQKIWFFNMFTCIYTLGDFANNNPHVIKSLTNAISFPEALLELGYNLSFEEPVILTMRQSEMSILEQLNLDKQRMEMQKVNEQMEFIKKGKPYK